MKCEREKSREESPRNFQDVVLSMHSQDNLDAEKPTSKVLSLIVWDRELLEVIKKRKMKYFNRVMRSPTVYYKQS